MKLLTADIVVKWAKDPKSAMDLSLIRWYQAIKMPWKELNPTFYDVPYAKYCGLCRYYRHPFMARDCSKCPLRGCLNMGVEDAMIGYLDKDYKPFRSAARRVFNAIIKISPYKSQKDWLVKVPKKYYKYIYGE